MKKKYNLALIPTSKSHEVINLAKKFCSVADKYILGEKSLPHVTLFQFQYNEEKIDEIWQRVHKHWDEKSINLQFNKFSYITFDNYIFWVSLLPDESQILHQMHHHVANILQLSINKTYDPHMTLINTLQKDYEKKVKSISKSYQAITDSFTLALGISDDIGQLMNVIYRYD